VTTIVTMSNVVTITTTSRRLMHLTLSVVCLLYVITVIDAATTATSRISNNNEKPKQYSLRKLKPKQAKDNKKNNEKKEKKNKTNDKKQNKKNEDDGVENEEDKEIKTDSAAAAAAAAETETDTDTTAEEESETASDTEELETDTDTVDPEDPPVDTEDNPPGTVLCESPNPDEIIVCDPGPPPPPPLPTCENVVSSDLSGCSNVFVTFDCTINYLNDEPCGSITKDSCTEGELLTIKWKVSNQENIGIDVANTCGGFPGCVGGSETYDPCYSQEIYATYEITKCLDDSTHELSFGFDGETGTSSDECAFSETKCIAFEISDEPLMSTLSEDDTCQ
jgi:hypothetical protein